jgi:hypothetical protein
MSYVQTNEIVLKNKHGYYCHICVIRIPLSIIQEIIFLENIKSSKSLKCQDYKSNYDFSLPCLPFD